MKDTKKLEQATVTNATRLTTHLAVRNYVDRACRNIPSVPANTAAISVKVMHIPGVSCAKNLNAERERRLAESAKREKKCLECANSVNHII